MARPFRFRRLTAPAPRVRRFLPDADAGPAEVPLTLGLEELEAVRLVDVRGLDQTRAAEQMRVSRPTFGRILMKARRTIGEALTDGRGLCIEGGVFQFEQGGKLSCPYCDHTQPVLPGLHRTVRCRQCCRPVQVYQRTQFDQEDAMDLKNARIAVATDDGDTVTSHFGRAPFYMVLTLKEGVVVTREQRSKLAPHAGGAHIEGHGHHHAEMIAPIQDCQVVVARGMGDGAYMHLTGAGLTTILTSFHSVEEVETAVREGTLLHQPQRVHMHGHRV